VIGSSGKRPDALELRSQVCSALFTLLSLPSTFLIVFSDLLYLVFDCSLRLSESSWTCF
jgi:hypothetical protein